MRPDSRGVRPRRAGGATTTAAMDGIEVTGAVDGRPAEIVSREAYEVLEA